MPPKKYSYSQNKEIKKFTNIANSWWDLSGPFAPLHKMNTARLEFIVQKLHNKFKLDNKSQKPLSGLSILDIGCGGGLLCEPLARLGASVTGIDAGNQNITAAKAHSKAVGLEIYYNKILPEEFSLEAQNFDIVLTMEVIEHVANVETFLKACSKMIRPNGAFFLSTLNQTLKSLLLAKFAAEYLLRWVPKGTHDWRKFISPNNLSKTLIPLGIEVQDSIGVSYSLHKD